MLVYLPLVLYAPSLEQLSGALSDTKVWIFETKPQATKPKPLSTTCSEVATPFIAVAVKSQFLVALPFLLPLPDPEGRPVFPDSSPSPIK